VKPLPQAAVAKAAVVAVTTTIIITGAVSNLREQSAVISSKSKSNYLSSRVYGGGTVLTA
jgi:hydroxyethylthiazole kinase-like sugar kinase family protein